jgi:ABC-type nickel/cobalt efflux system permease component RcnA
MTWAPPLLLVGAVAAVGVLHTIVPDHWVPIALIARERGWSKSETARAALTAGTGHVISTLLIGLAVWVAGAAFAASFGHIVDVVSSLALIAFGGWIVISAWRELRPSQDHRHGHGHRHSHPHEHSHTREQADELWEEAEPEHGLPIYAHAAPIENDAFYVPLRGETAVLTRHSHAHRHGRGPAHRHWHDHTPQTAHPVLAGFAAEPPLHLHRHKTTARTGLLLILGSSPMVEGIPAFFAAAKYGAALVSAMAAVFALGTIATYVVLCVYSTEGLQRLRLGAIERYGEVASGAVIMLVGVAFGLWPAF